MYRLRPRGKTTAPGMPEPGLRIGIDVGGTFTDLVLVDEERDAMHFGKVLTTPEDPSLGMMAGLAEILARARRGPAEVTHLVHGTTVVTNAVIERRGARVGLITTRGFRDVLEIGRETRHDPYNIAFVKPAPLVPRHLRLEVNERIDAGGRVRRTLARDELLSAIEALRTAGVEAVAVMFLHSPLNPAHEELASAILAEVWPEVSITLSSRVAPEPGEYERAVTAAANAYVQPLTRRYLHNLQCSLGEAGFVAPLSLLLSAGGLARADEVMAHPIQLIESGPAAGALAAALVARRLGLERALSFDMGGTTAKLALIEAGAPRRETRFEAARTERLQRGSGLPLIVPVVDLIEIGAGGGSVAALDDHGALRVGPRSTGAVPGPAAYGRGGTAATVTDADLVLGHLPAAGLLGGALPLDAAAAKREIRHHIGGPLGLSDIEAAAGISAVVHETMASAARTHAAERGHDPSTFALIAFGGAGPVHACDLAARLKIGTVVIPPGAGVMSAIGLIAAVPLAEAALTKPALVSALGDPEVDAVWADLAADATAKLRANGAEPDRLLYRLDARYRGQGSTIAVECDGAERAAAAIADRFLAAYSALFGRTVPGVPIEAVTWRVTALGSAARMPSTHRQPPGTLPRGAEYEVMHGADLEVSGTRLKRDSLPVGLRVHGPAIIEESEATTVIEACWSAEVSFDRSLIIRSI